MRWFLCSAESPRSQIILLKRGSRFIENLSRFHYPSHPLNLSAGRERDAYTLHTSRAHQKKGGRCVCVGEMFHMAGQAFPSLSKALNNNNNKKSFIHRLPPSEPISPIYGLVSERALHPLIEIGLCFFFFLLGWLNNIPCPLASNTAFFYCDIYTC